MTTFSLFTNWVQQVCNENFTEIIEDTLIFSEEDRIDSDEELSKVEAVLGGGI